MSTRTEDNDTNMFLPTTLNRWAGVAALSAVIMFAVPWGVLWLIDPAVPVRVDLAHTTAGWEPGRRSILVYSGPRTYTTSCPTAWLSQRLLTNAGGSLPASGEAIALAGDTSPPRPFHPRRQVSLSPGVSGGRIIRVFLPDSVRSEDVLGVALDVEVPTDQPCANGYVGSESAYQISLPDPTLLAEPTP